MYRYVYKYVIYLFKFVGCFVLLCLLKNTPPRLILLLFQCSNMASCSPGVLLSCHSGISLHVYPEHHLNL